MSARRSRTRHAWPHRAGSARPRSARVGLAGQPGRSLGLPSTPAPRGATVSTQRPRRPLSNAPTCRYVRRHLPVSDLGCAHGGVFGARVRARSGRRSHSHLDRHTLLLPHHDGVAVGRHLGVDGFEYVDAFVGGKCRGIAPTGCMRPVGGVQTVLTPSEEATSPAPLSATVMLLTVPGVFTTRTGADQDPCGGRRTTSIWPCRSAQATIADPGPFMANAETSWARAPAGVSGWGARQRPSCVFFLAGRTPRRD